jgi:polyhydroxybutyrate depolymerase
MRFRNGAAWVACAVAAGSITVAAQERLRERMRPRQPVQVEERQAITVAGRPRTYLVHDFSKMRPAPVVFVLHGGGGNAENAVSMTGFDRIGRREGLIVVYPDGTAARPRVPLLTWNAGHCCASAMKGGVDDVGFIEAVIDALVKDGRADASRVYATGMSNGAMMVHRLGRELSAKIAAIAPVAGAVFGDERPPAAPVAAFIVVGADDTVVPGAGGSLTVRELTGGVSAADRDVAPAIAQANYWAKANGCGRATTTHEKVSTVMEWRDCASGAPVVFHTVAHNGHAWPGGAPGRAGANTPTQDFDASDRIWAFFADRVREGGERAR